MKRIWFFSIGGVCLFLFAPIPAQAGYPDRETNVYCGSSAGGTTDVCIRILSETVSKEFGQPIVVVNKPGASHTVCANLVANAKPDGYTLGALSATAFAEVPHLRKVPYNVKEDFTWIATYTEYTCGLVVKADAPWKNLEEFLDYARKNPGKMTYGSDGYGVGGHIIMEYLALKKGGIDWNHVPIPGGAKLATSLLGGHIQAWSAAGTHVQFVKDGTMRLLVSYNRMRMKAAPNVPTLDELGYKGFPRGRYLVIIAPKGLPDPIQKKLEGAYLKAMKEPIYLKYLDTIQFPFTFADGKETAKNLEENSKIWREFIHMTGIKEKEK
ncbi:MAG: tripartite tricarboxylate transporter substrate binding protein [Deltaproteobacteria bacterium]|nr:tripartite tricarboxylate transporter substrate binding protein [Deltaproteobacteria bacterium]